MRAINILMIISFFHCSPINSSYECISLGEVCTVGAALQAFELRNAAYPFDWIISQYKPLCTVLEQNFHDFLNADYLSVREDNHGVINKYGLVFVHDFPTFNYIGNLETEDIVNENVLHPNWLQFLPAIQKKYDRRIQRLHDVCNDNKKIYFIRHGGIQSQNQACALRDILKTAYPYLDFILVIVGNDPSFANQWGEHNIRNYYLGNQAVWNDVAEWQKIFTDLGLLSASNYKNERYNYAQTCVYLHILSQHHHTH